MTERPNRTTIVVRPSIRDSLKHVARKDQSYNEILEEILIVYKQHQYDQIFFEQNEENNPGPKIAKSKARIMSNLVEDGAPS